MYSSPQDHELTHLNVKIERESRQHFIKRKKFASQIFEETKMAVIFSEILFIWQPYLGPAHTNNT